MTELRSHPLRNGLLFITFLLGGLLVATPAAQQGRGKQGGVPVIAVPTIVVPSAKVPGVPGIGAAPKVAALPQELRVLSPDQLAAYTEAAERKLPYLPGQVLVRFKTGISRTEQQRALSAIASAPDAGRLEWVGEVALLKDAGQSDAEALARQLSAQPEVAYAEPNYLHRMRSTPNDPSFTSRQWNLTSINMPRAWDITKGGSAQVIVAVIDSGVTSVPPANYTARTWNGSSIVTFSVPVAPSPDFDLSRFVSPRDFTVSLTAPPTTVIDTEGHGTHVAGTVGENTNNGIGLAGIAYNVKIMPLKACESYWDVQFARSAAGIPGFTPIGSEGCSAAAVAAAVRFAADNGAKVINISIGSSSPSFTERDAILYAVARGVFVAMSNGNAGHLGNPVNYPAAFASEIDGAMSVAATNRTNSRAFYSTTNIYTEIAAPGGDDRDFIWQYSIRAADSDEENLSLLFPRFDRYEETASAGTSMASPHVAGLAALLVSRGITNPATIEGILRQTARDLGTPGRDNEFGYGLIQPFAALFGLGGGR